MMRFMVLFFHIFLIIISSCVLSFELNKNDTTTTTTHMSLQSKNNLFKYKNTIVTDLNVILDVWNLNKIMHLWKNKRQKLNNISLSCEDDFSRYLNGFSSGFNWALKMSDASGQYSSGFLSGNKFWIGVPEQCREIQNEFSINNNNLLHQNNETINTDDFSSFAVAMNSVNLQIQLFNLKLIDHTTQEVTLGLCLPSSCQTSDVTNLVEFYINNNLENNGNNYDDHDNDNSRRITVNYVKNLSQGYSVWKDCIFYIILGSTGFVLLFVIMGTFYDIALRYKYLDELNAKSNSNSVIDVVVNKKNAETENNCMDTINNHELSTISKLWAIKDHNGSFDVYNSKTVMKPMSEVLLSFSLLLNLSKLTSLDVGQDTLAPIHGLKFISMLWAILIHTCLIANEISVNTTFRSKAENYFLYQTISNGGYTVDTFFFLSGCLVSFRYCQIMIKHKLSEIGINKSLMGKTLQFLGIVWYRYIRLTPPYLFVIGIVHIFMKWYHDHLIIPLTAPDHETCEKYWWRNALYINTYFPMDERCMPWSWYLAIDTQFYIFGLIILIVGQSFFIVGVSMGAITLLASWITTVIISLKTEHVPSIQDPFADYAILYDKPWTRFGPYLIGMATGWYLHNINCRLKMNKIITIIGWYLSFVILLSIVYGLYGKTFGPISSAIYTALSRSGWAIGIAWILIACVTNNGGFIAKILAWKYLYPLSRLSYCAYLIHPIIIRAIIYHGESPLHLSVGLITMLFFGIIIVSYAVSLILSLLFEAPAVSLLRILHPIRQLNKNKKNNTKNQRDSM